MKPVLAELLTIGDEILYGQIVDTNTQWMSVTLGEVGIRVIRKTSVGDNEASILTAFREAEERADIVLITGGLGPTNDDLTKPCLVKYFNCGLVMHEEALQEVTEFFKRRGRELTEINRQQAALPSCCEKITNALGTAPGMWFHRNGKVFVSMPGVPHEMKHMMTQIIVPKLLQTFQTPAIHHTVVRTVGLGESFLAEKIADWENALPPHMSLAYLPSLGEVRLRLTALGESKTVLEQEATELVTRLNEKIGQYIYTLGEHPLEVVVGDLLRQKQLTVAAAESCTGGYFSHLVTSVPGSSDYFSGSVIAYANEIKSLMLGVKAGTLKTHGAVSEETVLEMAEGVRIKYSTSVGVATSGIAGPGGGTDEKPVGTVWIAYADKHKRVAKKLQLSTDRILNIKASSIALLNLIRLNLPS